MMECGNEAQGVENEIFKKAVKTFARKFEGVDRALDHVQPRGF